MNTFSNKYKSILKMRIALLKESDRGACLLSVSYLENQLENLLKQLLIKSDKLIKKIFEGYGPLSTFSAKIDLSFLLGLISKQTYHDLDLIRKIRNEFAHSSDSINFNDEKIKNFCMSLNVHFRYKDEQPRKIFISTVCGIISRIILTESKINRILELKDPDGLENVNKQTKKLDKKINANIEEYKTFLNKIYQDNPESQKLVNEHLNEYIKDLFSVSLVAVMKIDDHIVNSEKKNNT